MNENITGSQRQMPGRRIDVISVTRFGEDGLIIDCAAYWGKATFTPPNHRPADGGRMDLTVNRAGASLVGLGPVRQIAFMVPDLAEAMGVGPFFTASRTSQIDVRYRGAPSDINFSVALSNWGALQLELIQPNDDALSLYRGFIQSGRRGMHHVCFYASEMADACARVAAAGGELNHEGRMPGGELFYADLNGGPGAPLLEVVQPPAWLEDLSERMQRCCAGWNGRDCVVAPNKRDSISHEQPLFS